MTDALSNTLKTLAELGDVDKNLLQVRAEGVRFENQVKEKQQKLSALEKEFERRNSVMKEKDRLAQNESKALKHETETLVERRKALGSLGNYKVQEAASREIDAQARQITLREEAVRKEEELLNRMVQAQDDMTVQISGLKKEVAELTDDKNAAAQSQKLRKTEYETRHRALTAVVNPGYLKIYERVQLKHPNDPVVPVVKGMCGGCFLKASPQFVVSLLRGDSIVQCSGCSRILFMTQDDKAAAPQAG